MIDLSDGMGGDVVHLARASGVCVILTADSIPFNPALFLNRGPAEARRLALSGGEDYEICFAVRPGTIDPIRDEFEALFSCPVTKVGSVAKGSGVFLQDGSDRLTLDSGAFQHFQGRP
jgi:thiamine-monophosphate kinase